MLLLYKLRFSIKSIGIYLCKSKKKIFAFCKRNLAYLHFGNSAKGFLKIRKGMWFRKNEGESFDDSFTASAIKNRCFPGRDHLHRQAFFSIIKKKNRFCSRRQKENGKIVKLKEKKLFLLDMDGTIYLDDTLFDGTLEFLDLIRRRGGRCAFLTNNSSRSVKSYVEKLGRMGIYASEEDFVTSVDALAFCLTELYGPEGKRRKIYFMGTASFKEQMRAEGFRVLEEAEPGIETLVVAFDRELTFQKLEDACILLGQGVDYLATNPDWVCPTAWGYVPDCGSICQMLKNATGRWPRFVGKPEAAMVRLALEKYHCAREETVLIGDRLYTDIACGVNGGIDTIFVLSGEGTRADLDQSEINPTWVIEDIGEVARAIREGGKDETEL